jgi:hypothetical protein
MSGLGHEDAFPPTTLSNRSRLGKPTFVGTCGNEQDAPITAIRQTPVNRLLTTCLAMRSPFR